MGGLGEGERGCGERRQKRAETCEKCGSDKSWTLRAQSTLQVPGGWIAYSSRKGSRVSDAQQTS